jgi:uncharacterized protein (TIGR04255 family)
VPVYPSAPLALVAFEVRYPSLAEPLDALSLRAKLREILPIPGSATQGTFTFGGATPIFEQQSFPRLMSRDRTATLMVTDEALVLETTTYDGYDEHRKLIEKVVAAAADVAGPDGIVRVGMRFIDEIRVPKVSEPPGDWSDWIAPGLLMPLAPDLTVGGRSLRPRTWQGVAVYDAGAGYAVQLKYGPQVGFAVQPNGDTRRRISPPSPGLFFLLDSDGAWTPQDTVPEFTPASVLDACDMIHEPLSALFKAISTDRLVKEVFMKSDADGG